MSKRHQQVFNLNDFKDKKRNEGTITITTAPGGEAFTIDPPAIWDDEITQLAEDNKNIEVAVKLLGGQERYDKFISVGGSSALLMSIIAESQGVDSPEKSLGSSSS